MAGENTNFNELTAITNDHYMPTWPDMVFDQDIFFKTLAAKGSMLSGGDKIKQSLMYQFTADGAYRDWQVGNTDGEDNFTPARFEWTLYRQHISVSDVELNKNEGPEGIFKLLNGKHKGAAAAMQNSMADAIYVMANDDAAVGLNSLPYLLGDGQSAYQPDGTAPTATCGEIDRLPAAGTYWRGQTFDFGSGTLGQQDDMVDAWFQVIDGAKEPNLILSSPVPQREFHKEAGASTLAAERYVNTSTLAAGFTTYTFQGTPWVIDKHCPDTQLYMLDMNALDLVSHKNQNFKPSKFQSPSGQPDINVMWVRWQGALTVSEPRRSLIMWT